jgi:hypothetical protein
MRAYYVTYRHATGYGSAEPYRTDEPLTTTEAMVDMRKAIAASVGRPADAITILMVHPLPDEPGCER